MRKLGLEGKVVDSCLYIDAYDDGVMITFTDGTVLQITERMQAGELRVLLNGNKLPTESPE